METAVRNNHNRNLIVAIAVLVALVGIALYTSGKTGLPSTSASVDDPKNAKKNPAVEKDPANPSVPNPNAGAAPFAGSPTNVYIGRNHESKIQTIFTTRRKSVQYQALVRYEPVDVPSDSVPGIKEILRVYGKLGKTLPLTLKRVDQETEMLTENLGEPLRFITSIKLYASPDDAHVVAYDMAQTTGGQPQRMIGYISKNGVTIEVYRGGVLADKQDITFIDKTWIPVEYEFIHQIYQAPQNKDARKNNEPIKFSIFVPEAMAQVLLKVQPLNDELIAVGDTNYDCAHYEVTTVSTQSADGIFAKQQMWFAKESKLLMRREDFDPSMAQEDAPVTDRVPYQRIDQLGRLSQLQVTPPELPEKSADFLLDENLNYTVRSRDKKIGVVVVRFSKYVAGKVEPPFMPETEGVAPAYFSTARVRVDTGESLRNEIAVTLYDAKWRPIHYETRGEENTGVKLNYHAVTRIANETVSVATHRDALPELKNSAAYQGANAAGEIGTQNFDASDAADWHDPLKRVPVTDDEASAQESDDAPRLLDQSWTRKFPDGTFISDYNRIEHLALIACRLPLPPPLEKPDDTPKMTYQKAAMYLVRQNRCGVVLFEVRPEQKPKLTANQKKRQTDEEKNEPPLFVASVTAAMMPCRLLLTESGEILELSMKYGSGDVTYTLDHPIMRRREEAEKKKQLQEGPRIVRPPWW